MIRAKRVFLLALAVTLPCIGPAIAKSGWSWIALDTQGTKWAISQGEAVVKINGAHVDMTLKGPADEIECKISGRIDRKSHPIRSNVRTQNVRARVVCYGTEMDESWFEGTLSVLSLGKSGVRQVIRVDDGFNIIALTTGT